VNNRCLRLLSALAVLILLRVPGRPQGLELPLLRGEVRSERQALLTGYFVELYDVHSNRAVDQTEVHFDGAFAFRNVSYGEYQIRITNGFGEVLYRDFVTVGAHTPPVEIRVPGERIERPPSGPVSVTQLQHPPSRKAFGAFLAAQKFSEAGQFEKAAAELEKAILISPEYAQAYTNLAAQHARMGRYAESIGDATHAMELTKPNAVDLSNLAYAQYMLKRYGEAVESARTAVRLDPANDKAQYMLGTLLVMQRSTLREGVAHLERASPSIPAARANLDQARRQLEKDAGTAAAKTPSPGLK
jgi:tetratricopeptide (TPR) repeat protein